MEAEKRRKKKKKLFELLGWEKDKVGADSLPHDRTLCYYQGGRTYAKQ